MAEQRTDERSDDGRHDFRAAAFHAGDEAIVDDKGHEFTAGRLAERDEADEQ